MSRRHRIALTLAMLIVIAGISFFWFQFTHPKPTQVTQSEPTIAQAPTAIVPATSTSIIGYSVKNRPIETYTFATGSTTLLFVGGMHGGYEWNSVLLAYDFIDYFNAHPSDIPKNLTIAVIPDLNPDGTASVIGKDGRFTLADVPKDDTTGSGKGRFNADQVDLNRNFDCNWQATSTWRNNVVSAGTSPFSEPEAVALRNYVAKIKPTAVVFWHSQANAVYASECHSGVLPETMVVMNTYAKAAGYKAVASFDAYPVTGDSEGWLASINIPAITVEMATHATVEWEKNLAGVTALITHFGTIAK